MSETPQETLEKWLAGRGLGWSGTSPEVREAIRAVLAERDEWRDIAKAEGADEEHERALVAERDALRAEVERVKLLLGKAAQEIHCAGPVDHRIRVMRREHSELVIRLTTRAEKLSEQVVSLGGTPCA
jgi:hypothetical protein